MIRHIGRPAAHLLRSVLGTNGVADRIATIEQQIAALRPTPSPAAPDESAPATTPPAATDATPALDINHLLHQCRGALMRDMPPGASRILSAGCAGAWYFDWIAQTYGPVEEHLGIEFYAPRPALLPPGVTWIANTAGNMEAVADKSVDLVINGENLEHLWPEEVTGFLIEASRVLKPDGVLVIDSPNRALTAPLNWSHPEHTIEFTVPEITHMLGLAGFAVTKTAGIWLCRDARTGRVLPFDPQTPDADWTLVERIAAARDRPADSFLWWIEGRRTGAAPDVTALRAFVDGVFGEAWPERMRRMITPANRTTELRGEAAWIVAEAGQPGAVIFGPYMPLPAGRYRATFTLDITGAEGADLGTVDVVGGPEANTLAGAPIHAGTTDIALEFDLPELLFGIQFRCISAGAARFAVRREVTLDTLTEPADRRSMIPALVAADGFEPPTKGL